MIFTKSSSKILATAISEMGEDDLLKQILVPIDFSECSNTAIRHAVAIAIRTGATIILAHIINPPKLSYQAPEHSVSDLEIEAAEKLSNIADEISQWLIRENLRKIATSYRVQSGFVSDEILDLGAKLNVDLIVMGTLGAGEVFGSLIGANATSVMQKAHCPVLIVPKGAEFAGFSKIAFATNMVNVGAATVERLIKFAAYFNAHVDVVHIVRNTAVLDPAHSSAFQERFTEMAQYEKLRFYTIAAEGRTISQSIKDYAQAREIDLLAIRNQGRGALDRLLKPSVGKRLALFAKIPLIAFH